MSSSGDLSAEKPRKPESDPVLRQVAKDVTAALHRMGFSKAKSHKAVACALAQDPSANLESLVKASLLATLPRPFRAGWIVHKMLALAHENRAERFRAPGDR